MFKEFIILSMLILFLTNTGRFTTCGHYCRRWFLRSLW